MPPDLEPASALASSLLFEFTKPDCNMAGAVELIEADRALPALLASARAVRNVEAMLAGVAQAHFDVIPCQCDACSMHRELTATVEPTAGEER